MPLLRRFAHQALDRIGRLADRPAGCGLFVSGCDFHHAGFAISRADNRPERHAQQIGIGKKDAGADSAVIVYHLSSTSGQFGVQCVGAAAHLCIAGPHGTQMQLPGGPTAIGQIGPQSS